MRASAAVVLQSCAHWRTSAIAPGRRAASALVLWRLLRLLLLCLLRGGRSLFSFLLGFRGGGSLCSLLLGLSSIGSQLPVPFGGGLGRILLRRRFLGLLLIAFGSTLGRVSLGFGLLLRSLGSRPFGVCPCVVGRCVLLARALNR